MEMMKHFREPMSAVQQLLLIPPLNIPPTTGIEKPTTALPVARSSLQPVTRPRRHKLPFKPIRPYRRSEVPRLRWSNDLHHKFVHVVEKLGGPERATPKMILDSMEIEGITIAHVKSHLQLYRSIKQEELIQDVLVKAKGAGSKKEEARVLAEMPAYLAGRRGVSRRHVRLQRLKALLAETQTEEGRRLGAAEQTYERELATAKANMAVQMPEEMGRKSHSYILFKDVFVSTKIDVVPNLFTAPPGKGQALATEGKNKEKLVEIHGNSATNSSDSTVVLASSSSAAAAAHSF